MDKTIVTRDVCNSKGEVLLTAGTAVEVISTGNYFAKVKAGGLTVTGVSLKRLSRDRVTTFQYSVTLPAEVSDKEASLWAYSLLASAGLADYRPVVAPSAYEAGLAKGAELERAEFTRRLTGVMTGIRKSLQFRPAGG